MTLVFLEHLERTRIAVLCVKLHTIRNSKHDVDNPGIHKGYREMYSGTPEVVCISCKYTSGDL